MPSRIYRTVLVTNFGKGTVRPLVAMVLRLSLSLGLSLFLGRALAKLIERADLPLGIPIIVAASLTVLLGFTVSGLVLLTIGSASKSVGHDLTTMFKLLPVRPRTRWLSGLLPTGLILGLIGIFGLLLLAPAAAGMQLPILTILAAWTFGLLAGLGLNQITKPAGQVNRLLLFVGLLIVGLRIFDQVVQAETELTQTLGAWLIIGLVSLNFVGYIQNFLGGYNRQPKINQASTKQLIPTVLPTSAWFLVKLARNQRTRSAYLISLGLSLFVALSIAIRHHTFSRPEDLLIFTAVLAATFACELRGTMRTFTPPEIAIKGTRSLFSAELIAALLAGVVVGLPVFFSLNSQVQSSAHFAVLYLLLQSFCSVAGLLAGTVLVPAGDQIGSQFFAAAIALGLVSGLIKVVNPAELLVMGQMVKVIGSTTLVASGAYLIEKLRRRHYGRT